MQFKLAEEYYEGEKIHEDRLAASVWASKAAAQGHKKAKALAAVLQGPVGLHLEQDVITGKWNQVPSQSAAPENFYQLAMCYKEGDEGFPCDPIVSGEYLRIAAAQGHPEGKRQINNQNFR